ncbi:phosphopyruvate hydratase [Candidatus Saccharibacteria bacterium]|jgi:enolase|nr:phosphopyruvate hydratase [Candidatus Saccharibacteria bacterium]
MTNHKISQIHARQILDSRGNPTVEAEIVTDTGFGGRAAVPSGASTGSFEAVERRDGSESFGGKSVQNVITSINGDITDTLIGIEVTDQKAIDDALVKLDGTKDKSRLGANAMLAVSLAAAHAGAATDGRALFAYLAGISGNKTVRMPMPMVNVLNGGVHAVNSSDIQEIMIVPIGATNFSEAIRMCAEVFQNLRKIVVEKGHSPTVGDEGGFALPNATTKQNIEMIQQACKRTGYNFGMEIALALDVAASELYDEASKRYILDSEKKQFSSKEMIDWLQELVRSYPIISIEDGLDESDWDGWKLLQSQLGDVCQLVGDDLFVTNTKLLQKGIDQDCANSILIKPNQIGTLSETIETVKLAQANNWRAIISHRSGETEDTTIAHLAVGLNTGQIKTGSMSRTDRIAKYNELLRIEEMLSPSAEFAGAKAIVR